MALIHEHELHYRCSFDLTSPNGIERTWANLVRLVRSWISGRILSEQTSAALGGRWFCVGGEWRPPKQSKILVKTERCIGQGKDLAPQSWAIRFEHPDSQIGARQWRTDIGITVIERNRVAFSLSTIHWLHAGYIGQEPPEPTPTAPRIVSDVLNCKSWEAHSGSEKLGTVPSLLRDGKAKLLVSHLEDVRRTCPIVLIAKYFATGTELLDPRRVARLLAGAAVVWESESSWVDKELEQALTRPFSCWNGMVRVYQSRVNLKAPSDSRRHRYFDKDDIEVLGVAKVEELLVRGVVRRSRPSAVIGVLTVEDVQAKQAQTRFAEELKRAGRGSQELASLLEHEVERLTGTIKEKDEDIALLQEYGEDADELRVEVARLKYEHGQALGRARGAETVSSALAAQASLLRNLDHLPATVPDVLELIGKIYSERMVFTGKALESAKKATLKNPNVAWACLRSMATLLYDLHFEQQLPFREVAQKFRDSTGFELAIGESETTKKHKKLGAMRKDVYKGEEIDISPHVKHGTSPGNALRVHYFVHPEDRLLVIGHCGDHLDTVRTN
ncbi:MAG: hypothetical protein WA755_05470 [Candidatus Acidiferrales bacterium]